MPLVVFDLEGTIFVRGQDGRYAAPEGLRACLDAWAPSPVLCAIATRASRRRALVALNSQNLTAYFLALMTADDGPSKPHPFGLERVMAEAGTRPDETVMVGDTDDDMIFGRNAGVLPIGVTWSGASSTALTHAGAGAVVGSVQALRHQVETHFGLARGPEVSHDA
ncbi:MAG: HAD-IA family hydrolase [Pseudomonadota bacterium]